MFSDKGFAVSLLHHNFDGVTFYSIPSYNLFPLKKKKKITLII